MLGRWTTVDLIHAGVNWYVYVNNDPVNRIDPLGLSAAEIGGSGSTVEPASESISTGTLLSVAIAGILTPEPVTTIGGITIVAVAGTIVIIPVAEKAVEDIADFLGLNMPEKRPGEILGKAAAELNKSRPKYSGSFEPEKPPNKPKRPIIKAILDLAANVLSQVTGAE